MVILGGNQERLAMNQFGSIILQTEPQKALVEDQELSLTPYEFKVFQLLVDNGGKILARSFMTARLAGMYGRTLDSHISHIRQKLRRVRLKKAVQIVSVYGVGYCLEFSSEE
jgi:DNA-binding response OmpR family regulator